MDTRTQERVVACPSCNGRSVFSAQNIFRPFCSAHCKNLDLGAWADEAFRLGADAPPDDMPFGDPKAAN